MFICQSSALPCHVHNSRMLDTITPLHANSPRKGCFFHLVFLHPPAASEADYRKGLRTIMIRSNPIHTLVLEPTSIQCSSVKAGLVTSTTHECSCTITPLHANSPRKRCFFHLVFLHPPAASEAHYRKGLRRKMIRSKTIHTLVLEPTSIQCSSVKCPQLTNARYYHTSSCKLAAEALLLPLGVLASSGSF